MNEEMLKEAIFPSFEEESLRPSKKCHATLNRAQRGRSETCFRKRLTPGFADLNVATHLLDRLGYPSSKEGPKPRGLRTCE